jgi:cystathionine gamma-synthase
LDLIRIFICDIRFQKTKSMKLETLSIHAGALHDDTFGSVTPPIILSTTFERNIEGAFPEGRDIYTRASNPNRRALEQKLAALENGVEAISFASGQAATLSVFHAVLQPNAHVIIPDDIYYGTRVVLEKLYGQWNVSYSAVDMTNTEGVARAITKDTKLIWIESPSNPSLKVTDIQGVTDIAKHHGIVTACDNTWATPYFTQPFSHGVDLIMHSNTKYFGGHSDILGGCIIVNKANELSQKIRDFQTLGGGVPSAFDCWLLYRSLATFPIRMQAHGANAQKLAEYLAQHQKVEKVMYPGLPNNEYHEVSKKQMQNGFGGMMSILVKGNETISLRFASKLKLVKHATSLGGVETLVDHRRSAEGVHSNSPQNLIRISVGIEHIDDLIADFEQAFSQI